MAKERLGAALRKAREAKGMTLREAEQATGINNAHISQVENGTIGKPDLSLLYALSLGYGVDYRELLRLASYGSAAQGSERERQRMSVAMHAMGELTAKEQTEVLGFMAELRKRKK